VVVGADFRGVDLALSIAVSTGPGATPYYADAERRRSSTRELFGQMRKPGLLVP